MAEPFIGQIIMFGGNFQIRGYAFCQGQLLGIAQNTALFSILGTTYGGNGQTTFGLPDLRGRVPLQPGQGPGLTSRVLGELAGAESVTLTTAQLPAHIHTATFTGTPGTLNTADAKGSSASPVAGGFLARGVDGDGTPSAVPWMYVPAATQTVGNTVAIGGVNAAGTVTVDATGSNSATSVMQPYLALNFEIALQGIFPSRN